LWKRTLKSSKLIKPQFADWGGSIKSYLNLVDGGHFRRQLGKNSGKKERNFYKKEKIQRFGKAEYYMKEQLSKHKPEIKIEMELF
jgi:hypothetical protein